MRYLPRRPNAMIINELDYAMQFTTKNLQGVNCLAFQCFLRQGMLRTMAVILASFNVLLLPACSIKQDVHPVNADILSARANRIALIRNDAVRFAEFNNVVAQSLERCGFIVETLPQGTNYDSLPLAMTYTANWSWDIDLYMSYARLEVFQAGKKIGDGVYDATGGGGLIFSKFIKANEKVDQLVYGIFPTRAPIVVPAAKSAYKPTTP